MIQDTSLVQFYSDAFIWIAAEITPQNNYQGTNSQNSQNMISVRTQERRIKTFDEYDGQQKPEEAHDWAAPPHPPAVFRHLCDFFVRLKSGYAYLLCWLMSSYSLWNTFRPALPTVKVFIGNLRFAIHTLPHNLANSIPSSPGVKLRITPFESSVGLL